MSRPRVTIYTDGGCQPNPGPGGWGAVLVSEGEEPQELSGAEASSTNNRMELTAAIRALEALELPSSVDMVTDSIYLRDGITRWIDGWRRRGWVTTAKQPVKNQDLWQALDEQVRRHRVRWQWTRGHAGDRGNERAHELAAAAIDRPELPLGDRHAVHVFLGVAWSGKQGRGAWGAVLCHGDRQKELAGRLQVASANAAHIASAVCALEALRGSRPVHAYTVSDYLRDGATKWLPGWRRRGWRTREDRPVANREWWQRLEAGAARRRVHWHVLGRDALTPEVERARELAREALGR